ncbi:GNAT family N-acetyltransferase [Arthrobacter sp. UYCu712]|uniref:GNAT family N-acetyltransferase n=1 Tax=Arthrobacter sp. UYCu712 TaxID=3156340 RepID=UPI003399B829
MPPSNQLACRRNLRGILGWAAVSPAFARPVYSSLVEHSVYVAAQARGRGLGAGLLQALADSAERDGIWTIQATPTVTELTLGVIAHNSPARDLYESLGFRGSEVARRTPMGDQVWESISMRQRREHRH